MSQSPEADIPQETTPLDGLPVDYKCTINSYANEYGLSAEEVNRALIFIGTQVLYQMEAGRELLFSERRRFGRNTYLSFDFAAQALENPDLRLLGIIQRKFVK